MKRANLLFFLLLILSAGLHGQAGGAPAPIPKDPLIYFYNPRLDGLGQDVQKAAGDVANGQIFDTQLSNLDSISKLATDRIFSSGRRAALAKLEGARDWKSFCSWVDAAKSRALASDTQKADWTNQIAILKTKTDAAQSKAAVASDRLKTFGDLLGEVGKAQQIIEVGKFLQGRTVPITATDLRVVSKLQEAMDNLGTLLNGLAAQPKLASTRSAAEQMKVDLAKAEIDHLKTLIQIEEKRLDGQDDVKDLLTAIDNTINCRSNSGFTFVNDAGVALPLENLNPAEEIQSTIQRFQTDPLRLKSVIYLLENFAALAARADTPVRLAELRTAIEERRFAIRRDAIMARTYEQILLIGAQRIATFYKGGIKPETLAQIVNAISTAGLIPTIALK
jgi:hypothetical protein